jgi:hypothetical protein
MINPPKSSKVGFSRYCDRLQLIEAGKSAASSHVAKAAESCVFVLIDIFQVQAAGAEVPYPEYDSGSARATGMMARPPDLIATNPLSVPGNHGVPDQSCVLLFDGLFKGFVLLIGYLSTGSC